MGEGVRPGYYLACFATCFAVVVVVLGAYTRLVDAGLGCPDWPGCYGFLVVPEAADDRATAQLRFPDHPVESHKGWPEMVHRYFAGTLGLLVLALAVTGWRNRRLSHYPVRHSLGLLGLVILQAAFGMWTVTLKLWPQIVVAHLLGGFATLSLLFLLALRLRNRSFEVQWRMGVNPQTVHRWALLALCLVVVQVMLGGWTSANYAALACTDFPTCHGQWAPDADFSQGLNLLHPVGPNYQGGLLEHPARVAIHLSHRIGALAVTLSLLLLMVLIIKSTYNASLRRSVRVMALVLVAQISLGITNVLAGLPLLVAVTHNAIGAGLLITLVWINFQLRSAKVSAT